MNVFVPVDKYVTFDETGNLQGIYNRQPENENFIKVVKSSAFCSEDNNIISDNYIISKDQKIGIIPPIGGG